MTPLEAQSRINQLRTEIEKHERLYRLENAPVISDDDFDMLMHKLRALEKDFPQFYDPNSPSIKVGNDLSDAFISVNHIAPMLSLDNVFTKSELFDFDSRLKKVLGVSGNLDYCVEPKIDGAGISAVYENGKLARLLTRGDGEKGDDITRNAHFIKNLPLVLSHSNIDFPQLLEIRGEAYMENQEFERIKNLQRKIAIEKEIITKEKEFQKSADSFLQNQQQNLELSEEELKAIERKLSANPRNLTAGTMKLLPKSVEKNQTLGDRKLKAVFYSIGTSEGFEFKEQSLLPKILADWGLPSVNWFRRANGIDEVFEKICELEEIRADFAYNTDGAVIKLNDCALHDVAGMTSHAPRWAVAWKYRAERTETKINEITLQVGRTGFVTPVAELTPVHLSGSTVSRATLHNAGNIAEKDIRVEDTVVIEKAGEIIPAVLSVNLEKRPKDSTPFIFPDHCPACGSLLERYGEKQLHRCPNFSCPPQVEGRLEHFASRDCMDIRGLGEKVVAQLIKNLAVKNPSDLYNLTKEDLLSLGKFKEKSATNLINAIADSKKRDLWRLIYGLGIPEIGEQFAKEIAKKFESLDSLMNADIEQIKEIEGFGAKSKIKDDDGNLLEPVRAMSIIAFFADESNRRLIKKLKDIGLNFESENKQSGALTPFTGKSFVITGTLNSMGRAKAKELIEKFGGSVAAAVTKSTNFLISNGDMEGSKAQKAKELGTKVIDEIAFLDMLKIAEIEDKKDVSEAQKNQSPSTENSSQLDLGI